MQGIPQLAFTVALELIRIALLAGTAASLAVMLRGLARDDAAISLVALERACKEVRRA